MLNVAQYCQYLSDAGLQLFCVMSYRYHSEIARYHSEIYGNTSSNSGKNLRYRNPHEKLATSMLAEPCRNPLFRPYLVQRIGPNSRSSAETIANRKSFWVRYFRSLTLNIQDSDSGFEVKTFGIAIHIALKSLPKACCRAL